MEPDSAKTKPPFVTIAITSKEDERRIEACLRVALAQDYPKDAIEIIVADGMSMDATREVVLRIADEDASRGGAGNHRARVRLIDNRDRTRASGLNQILAESRGEIIVLMDPSGDYARTHASKCVDALSTPAPTYDNRDPDSPPDYLAIVPRSAGRTIIERALSAVQSTKLAFAAGSELGRSGSESAPTLLGAVRRRVFDRVGMFDPGARCEEDVELSRRITRVGGAGALTVRRDIVVHRVAASSFKDLFRRHYQLGKSRGRRTIKDRRVSSIRELGPLAIVTIGGVLAATATVQPFTITAAATYALMTGAAAVRVGRSEGMVTIPIAWVAYPVMHLAHGVGFGSGLVRSAFRPDWKASTGVHERDDRVPPSVI